jgi:hypothetical protein
MLLCVIIRPWPVAQTRVVIVVITAIIIILLRGAGYGLPDALTLVLSTGWAAATAAARPLPVAITAGERR